MRQEIALRRRLLRDRKNKAKDELLKKQEANLLLRLQIRQLYRENKVQGLWLMAEDQITCFEFVDGLNLTCPAAVDLNGPTVVIIISNKAVIFANISPFDKSAPADGTAVVEHAEGLIDKIFLFYRTNRQTMFHDVDEPYGVIVAAERDQLIMNERVVEMIRERFEEERFGHEVALARYETKFPSELPYAPTSTVVVDGRQMEDKLHAPEVRVNGVKVPRKGNFINTTVHNYNTSDAHEPFRSASVLLDGWQMEDNNLAPEFEVNGIVIPRDGIFTNVTPDDYNRSAPP